MEAVSVALVMLLAVVASAAVARMLPVAVPAPLVQIATGFAVGLVADVRVALDPDLFFLLFVPPLLFLDGWRIPKDALRRDLPLVAELAIGLVVFTVVGAGLLIHALVPMLPMAVCFALAAVLSPTDPIAVSAIAERVAVPPRMLHILEGESMFNDASGLVCLRFAVAAATTGVFSLPHAAGSFAWMALAGFAIGVATTAVATRADDAVVNRFGEEPGARVLVSVLIPFGAYLLAEQAHASGILAVVAAGVAMTFVERRRPIGAEPRIRREAVWDLLRFALNGVIFVLLGEQLPEIFAGAARAVSARGDGGGYLVALVLIVAVALALLRFAWVWASLRFTLLRRREERPFRSSDLRLVAAFSVGGVRGAITLAGILTLPLAMPDGSPFPGRDFAIFLSAAVILVSLLVASVALPLLLNGLVLPVDDEAETREHDVREAVNHAAIRGIEAAAQDHADEPDADAWEAAAERIATIYRRRARGGGEAAVDHARRQSIDTAMRLAGMRAARAEIGRLAATGEAGSQLSARMIREIDLMEMRFTS